jgi:DNA-binding beta-propeller fold protein YncE
MRAQIQAAGSTELVQTIQLPKVTSHFDHFGVDPDGGRLFATLQTENLVHVYQLQSGAELGRIAGIGKPHAVLFRQDLDRLFITDGNHDHGIVHIVDGKTFTVIKSIDLAPGAEQYSYDPKTKYMYVGNGGHDASQPYSLISIIDTSRGRKVGDIKVDTPNLEATTLEVRGNRLYANDRLNGKVIVINRKQRKVLASWPITGGKMNVAIALDENHHRLFIGCRSGAIAVFDTRSGTQVATLPIGGDIDDLMYDPASKRIFAPTGGGSGALSIYQEVDPDHYSQVATVTTGPGGKNGTYVPSVSRYFVGVPQHGTTDDQILVYGIK